ncbi:protein stum [Plutella xylostella]|uniref:protein stum n=1 Tax=Plutella xylostella TaxID=51655 RepID=UPI002032F90B|nr:protein stum [Plutella xylostella]
MALKLKYTDEHGILHIDMSPSCPSDDAGNGNATETSKTEITDPKFDTINNRFGQYDLFGGKYDVQSDSSGDGVQRSLFRSRYNSVEEELANTPYAFTTDKSVRLNSLNNNFDITIKSRLDDASPSKDIEDDRFFNRNVDYDLFGPQIDFQTSINTEPPAFTVTQLIHAQDRYFDLSSRATVTDVKSDINSEPVNLKSEFEVRSAPNSARDARIVRIVDNKNSGEDEAFTVLAGKSVKAVQAVELTAKSQSAAPTSKRKRESSFAILAERPASPCSLPCTDTASTTTRRSRVYPATRTTPQTAVNSRANSPVRRRRTSSLSRIDNMADTATLPPPMHTLLLSRPHSPPSPRDFVRENIEEVRELSEFNREMHEAEAEQKRLEEEEALLKEMGLLDKNAKLEGRRSVTGSKCNSRNASRSNSPGKIKLRSRSNSPSTILHYEIIPPSKRDYVNGDDAVSKPVVHNSRMRSVSRSQPQSNNVSPKHSKIPKRQSSVSPTREGSRWEPKRPVENKLNKNQRFISNSTSSINEAARIGDAANKRGMSKSQQHLNISPAHIRGKPPISPGRGGPPPSNRAINAKRLSPIVGTPNKSPVDGSKPGSARTPTKTSPNASKPVKTAGSTPATSRLNSRQPSRPASRDPSPEKGNRPSMRGTARLLSRVPSTKAGQNQDGSINRSESMKSLNDEKSPIKRRDLRDKTMGMSAVNTFMQGKKAPVPAKRGDMRNKTLGISTMNSFMQGKKAPLPPKNNRDMKNKTLGISTMNSFMQGKKTQDKAPLIKNNSKKELRNSTMSSIASLNTLMKGQKPQEKSPELTKKNSKVDLKEKSMSLSSVNSFMQGVKKDDAKTSEPPKSAAKKETKDAETKYSSTESSTDEIMKQDIHTQVDNTITNEKGELVILTKKSIVSMTTAAITAQPLEIVTTVTNQLPTSLEKAREKGMFERHSSRDSILGKDTKAKEEEVKPAAKEESKPLVEEKKGTADEKKKESAEEKKNEPTEEKKRDSAKPVKDVKDMARLTTIFTDDSVKLKPLQPPYNNPQVEKVKQKIDDILRSPEVSPQNILASAAAEPAPSKSKFKSMASKSGPKTDMTAKLMDMKSLVAKQIEKEEEAEMRTEATKIVDSIITPVEEPKPATTDSKKEEVKTIEPVVTVVNEKKTNGPKKDLLKAMTAAAVVKQEAEVEVQSSNVSTPVDKMEVQNKMADGASEASATSNGGFPQSTSTTPKPPARAKHSAQSKNSSTNNEKPPPDSKEESPDPNMKQPNICSRLMSKCAAKCCPCCVKPDAEDMEKIAKVEEGKVGWMSKINCCKKKEVDAESMGTDAEAGFRKVSIDFENETKTKRKRKFRDILCGCCGRSRRVSDAGSAAEVGCCGRRRQVVERRDSILSDRPPTTCCDNRVFNWLRGACRRSERGSRRNSMFSKNKSLSPTIPSEDNRPKLDPSLIEHSSTMRGAIPILPQALAYLCLVCNVIVPGLGTVFSGMFCLCFGIPRFGAHDGPRPRIGAFVMNLFVGAGQLFTVLFCLVGWGWSIWWGVIMIRVSRKYRRLKAEAEAAAAAEAAQAAPPVTTNNHARV